MNTHLSSLDRRKFLRGVGGFALALPAFESFGRTMGAMGPIITLSIMPAYAIVGRLFDSTGNNTMGLWVMTGLLVVAAVLLIPLKLESRTP